MNSYTTAIIVTFNSAKFLNRCLSSLYASEVASIRVVDNASVDASSHIAQTAGVLYQQQAHNQGFATAANHGARGGTTDYLLFLNPDACLLPGSLAQAEDYLKTHRECGAVGLLLQDEQGRPELGSFGSVVTPWSVLIRHWHKQRLITEPLTVGWVSGGSLLVRCSVFEQVHGFDPAFFLYWEDVDLCRRLTEATGLTVVVVPQAPVIHYRGHSLTDQLLKAQLYDVSADRYFRKHYATWIWYFQQCLRRLYRWWQPAAW